MGRKLEELRGKIDAIIAGVQSQHDAPLRFAGIAIHEDSQRPKIVVGDGKGLFLVGDKGSISGVRRLLPAIVRDVPELDEPRVLDVGNKGGMTSFIVGVHLDLLDEIRWRNSRLTVHGSSGWQVRGFSKDDDDDYMAPKRWEVARDRTAVLTPNLETLPLLVGNDKIDAKSAEKVAGRILAKLK